MSLTFLPLPNYREAEIRIHFNWNISLALDHSSPKCSCYYTLMSLTGILRGFVTFVKHSSRIPLSTSAWEATQALVCKWLSFQKKIPSTEKKYLLWHVMLEKNMLHCYMPGKYILFLQVWETNFLLRVNHPYIPSKVKWSTPKLEVTSNHWYGRSQIAQSLKWAWT